MNNMSECFEHQISFGRTVLEKKGVKDASKLTLEELSDWTFYFTGCLHVEAVEVMGENEENLDWKRHRAPKGNYRPEEAIKELVDLQKYLWNLFDIWGVQTPEQFVAAFQGKSAEVLQRWENEQDAVNTKSRTLR